MRWAIAFHPEQIDCCAKGQSRLMAPPMLMPEDRLAAARSQGWIVLGTDSDVYPGVDVDANLQSNPQRRLDDGPRDHGEQ